MTFHFKIDLPSEICPYTECHMLKFITTFLKVFGSANNQVRRMNHHRARVELTAESVSNTGAAWCMNWA